MSIIVHYSSYSISHHVALNVCFGPRRLQIPSRRRALWPDTMIVLLKRAIAKKARHIKQARRQTTAGDQIRATPSRRPRLTPRCTYIRIFYAHLMYVSMCIYIYIYTHMYVYIYIYIYTCTSIVLMHCVCV